MSWDLVLRHLAAIKASVEQQRVQLELLGSQVGGLEAYAKHCEGREQQGKARIDVPATCAGQKATDCARLSEDAALHVGGLSGDQVMCSGCGLDPRPIG